MTKTKVTTKKKDEVAAELAPLEHWRPAAEALSTDELRLAVPFAVLLGDDIIELGFGAADGKDFGAFAREQIHASTSDAGASASDDDDFTFYSFHDCLLGCCCG